MSSIQEIIERTYSVFSKYEKGMPFACDYCHPEEWQNYYLKTPLKEISGQHGYEMVTEVSDHWTNSDIYRHYLPRILELLGPPNIVDTLCPEFIFNKILDMGFKTWCNEEKTVVHEYFQLLDKEFPFGDKEDWNECYREFKNA